MGGVHPASGADIGKPQVFMGFRVGDVHGRRPYEFLWFRRRFLRASQHLRSNPKLALDRAWWCQTVRSETAPSNSNGPGQAGHIPCITAAQIVGPGPMGHKICILLVMGIGPARPGPLPLLGTFSPRKPANKNVTPPPKPAWPPCCAIAPVLAPRREETVWHS